jgi:DNA-binding SARP family transcriptional activator
VEFRVLGPLEVRRDGRRLDLPGSKRRALLALLILRANEVVRSDRLIEELWGERQPANAAAALQNHVSRLRKDLGADVLVTKPWGYVLRAGRGSVDLRRFEWLLEEAKPLAARERRAKLAEALDLWRGPALADLADEEALAAEIRRLEDLRLGALEQRIDADLELGGHEQLVPELEWLVSHHPLRERLRGQLILALYRSGRQAEALETYRETRRVLVEELGIEPSRELRDLEHAILRQDPALASLVPVSTAAVEPPNSRWRWPRSPFVVGATFVLALAAAATVLGLLKHGPAAARSQSAGGPRLAAVAADDFGDGVLDPRLWDRELGGKGAHLVERNKRLEMTIDASASVGHLPPGMHGSITARVWSQCRFVGDFDASVDFKLLRWPRTNGVVVEFVAGSHLNGDDWTSVAIARQSFGSSETYAAWWPPNSQRFFRSDDRKGSLRITRRDRVLTAYYKARRPDFYQPRWRKLATVRTTGLIRPVVFFLWVLSPENAFGHRTVTVALDNFFAAAEHRLCD